MDRQRQKLASTQNTGIKRDERNELRDCVFCITENRSHIRFASSLSKRKFYIYLMFKKFIPNASTRTFIVNYPVFFESNRNI